MLYHLRLAELRWLSQVSRCVLRRLICVTAAERSISAVKPSRLDRLESILFEPRRAAITKETSCRSNAVRGLARHLGRRGAIATSPVYGLRDALRKLLRRLSAVHSRSQWPRR